MGKAAKFKRLRKLAAQLPQINTRAVVGERISGKELMGLEKDAKGNPIDSRLTYTRKKIVTVPLNHHKKMKQFYNKYGTDGVKGYIAAVIDTHEKQKS
jgi:hypothetical protein